jgi:hypothetical protein
MTADGRIVEPTTDEPSQRHARRALDRLVLGVAYAVQWVRSKWSSHHEGRS